MKIFCISLIVFTLYSCSTEKLFPPQPYSIKMAYSSIDDSFYYIETDELSLSIDREYYKHLVKHNKNGFEEVYKYLIKSTYSTITDDLIYCENDNIYIYTPDDNTIRIIANDSIIYEHIIQNSCITPGYNTLVVYAGKIYITDGDSLLKIDGSNENQIELNIFSFYSIYNSFIGEQNFIYLLYGGFGYNTIVKVNLLTEETSSTTIGSNNHHITYFSENNFLVENDGYIKILNTSDYTYNNIAGPVDSDTSIMQLFFISNDAIGCSYDRVTEKWNRYQHELFIYVYDLNGNIIREI